MNCIGIDLSVTSPGLCVIEDDITNKIHFYFFALRKKHLDFQYTHKNISMNVIGDLFNKQWKNRIERYEYIVQNIVETMNMFQNKKIVLEGYAFSAQGQGLTSLAELRGILLKEFYDIGWEWEEVPPTKIKKFFSGSGNANKYSMLSQWKSMGIIDLYEELEMKESAKGNVPSPIQDIVDAYALALFSKGEKIKNFNMVNNLLMDLKSEIKKRKR